jgi:peptidoglycan hydrolase-like protein with peptidoglycan-binding domain
MQKHKNTKRARVTNKHSLQSNAQIGKRFERSLVLVHDNSPLSDIACKIGDNACAAKHLTISRHTGLLQAKNRNQRAHAFLRLQQQYGNRFVNRIMSQHAVQTKLKIGEPGDQYELEASRVADQVMAMLDSAIQPKCANCEEELQMQSFSDSGIPSVQMQPVSEEEEMLRTKVQMQPIEVEEEMIQPKIQRQEEDEKTLQMKCKACELKDGVLSKSLNKGLGEEDPLIRIGQQMLGKSAFTQPKPSSSFEQPQKGMLQAKSNKPAENVTDDFNQKLRTSMSSGGSYISEVIQKDMEHRFGANFNHIRIHNDSSATDLNNEINAKAFTHQNHIFFNSGQYNPENSGGKRLLAHELTHTIQQGTAEKNESIQRTIGDGHDFDAASRFHGNAALEATFDNERTIQNGHSGTHVTLVQTVLTGLGYDLPIHGVDGSFGSETQRAVRAFQQDVGLGVDGVVGHRTVDLLDRRDRGLEVAPPARPVTVNAPFNVNNAIVRPGAASSNALGACDWGLTFPENVRVRIDLFRNGAFWQPVLSEVVGNYSLQHRLLPAQTEVTGPGGNTNAGNYCAQITELNALGFCPGVWYMDAAVLEHERVHATRFRPALIHPTVITPLETAIEAINIPVALAANAATAEILIRANPAFVLALINAQRNWLARILVLVAGDHAAGGPSATAEHTIVDPMVTRICAHARANGWAACPPLCP